MDSNPCEFNRYYRTNGSLKAFETNRDAQPFGPAFEIRSNGEPKEFGAWLNRRPIGTHMSWIDTGEKHFETYFSPDLKDAAIGRGYLADWLLITEASQSDDPCLENRWSTPSVSLGTEQFQEAKCSEVRHLIDARAELDWCTTEEEGLSRKAPTWPNGQTAFLGFRYGQLPSGAVITFWENGAVRTVGDRGAEGIVGTRSCFSRYGELTAEQNFFRFGWSTGCWVNRFFQWKGTSVSLSKVEIFKNFQLIESRRSPNIRTVLDESYFNSLCDPLYKSLKKMSYQPEAGEFAYSDKDEDLIDWESLSEIFF